MHGEKLLGLLKPLGGGDPIPLKKPEMTIGRRPSSDIRLDFENVSGRHCVLSFVNGTWHIRDLGSTNGTKLNGQKLSRLTGIMPDDELAIASHLFTLDYEPTSPMAESHQVLDDEEGLRDERKPTSLMELAGFTSEGSPKVGTKRPEPRPEPEEPTAPRPPSADEADLDDDDVPGSFPPPAAPAADANDDDFFKLIEDEVRRDDR